MRIGAPVTPLDDETTEHIALLVEAVDAIGEAHLPMVYIPGVIDPPAITLAILPRAGVQDIAGLAGVLSSALSLILEPGRQMLIIPMPPEGGLVQHVRQSNTQIYPRQV